MSQPESGGGHGPARVLSLEQHQQAPAGGQAVKGDTGAHESHRTSLGGNVEGHGREIGVGTGVWHDCIVGKVQNNHCETGKPICICENIWINF